MSANALKFTTHEGVTKVVPIDTVRIVKPLTAEDKRTGEGIAEREAGHRVQILPPPSSPISSSDAWEVASYSPG